MTTATATRPAGLHQDSPEFIAAVLAREEKIIRAARVNRTVFKAYVLEDEMGNALEPGDIHSTWDQHVEWCIKNHFDVSILAPWGHGKTEWMVLGDILFDLARNPQIRIKICCNSDANASARVLSLRKTIEENEKFKRVFPGIEADTNSPWNAHKLYIKRKGASKDPSIEAVGILSAGIGGRADKIVFDDPVDFKNAIAEPKSREVITNSIKQLWLPRLDRKTEPINYAQILYIATPWHEKDATYSYVMRNDAFSTLFMAVEEPDMNRYKCLRSGVEKKTWYMPLWEPKFSRAELQHRRKQIGEPAYARGYRLRPFSDTDILLKSFANCIDNTLTPAQAMRLSDEEFRIISAVDPSGSKRSGFAIFTLAVGKRTGLRIPLDIRVGSWKGKEAVEQCLSVQSEYSPDVFIVENNAVQERFMEWLQDAGGADINTKAFQTGANKADPEAGVPGMDIEFSNGLWKVCTAHVQHGEDCTCPWCRWMKEVKYYPIYGSTDILMASWFAREEARGGKSLTEIIAQLEGVSASYKKENSGGAGRREGPKMEKEFLPVIIGAGDIPKMSGSNW
jgi:hypothetical protein